MKDGLAFFNTFLLVFAVIALFVGAFIIFNTFSIIVAQRQKEMALLRALGASRRQVIRSVLVEAFVVGLIASARRHRRRRRHRQVAEDAARRRSASTSPPVAIVVRASTIVISLAVGTIVTVVSALIPARRAGRVPPVAAMRAVAIDRDRQPRKPGWSPASASLAAGVGALVAGLADGAASPSSASAPLVMFIGVAVLAPVHRPTGGTRCSAGRWPSYAVSPAASAARTRCATPSAPRRTAAALMIGVGLVGFITTFAASAKASINSAVDKDFRGDYVLDTGRSASVASATTSPPTWLPSRSSAPSRSIRSAPAEVDGGGTDALQLGRRHGRRRCSTSTPSRAISPRSAPTASRSRTATPRTTGGRLGSQIPVTFSQGQTTLTVEAIYGDGDVDRYGRSSITPCSTRSASITLDADDLRADRRRRRRRHGRTLCSTRPPLDLSERRGHGPRRVQGITAGRHRHDPQPDLRPARPGDRDRPDRHHQHPGAVDLRAHPGARVCCGPSA